MRSVMAWSNIGYALLGEDTVSDPLGSRRDQREPDVKPANFSSLREIHGL